MKFDASSSVKNIMVRKTARECLFCRMISAGKHDDGFAGICYVVNQRIALFVNEM